MSDENQVTIKLPSGSISAAKKGNLIHARGVKYAEIKRFEPPHPVAPWVEIADHTQPSTICPQAASRLAMVTGPLSQGRDMDENCGHLSIAAPADGRGLPVMVFLHGGAYLTGGGDLDCYHGLELASRGVVVVGVTYRLGIFGYLPIKGVSPANLGLLDQIAALEWVQTNIARFGGDANNVTLFGESAGADSIFCLLVSNGTEGLFHQAILQSAPLGRRKDKSTEGLTRSLSKIAEDSIRAKTASNISMEEMLELQLQLLLAAKNLGSSGMPFAPIFGQHPLPSASELDDTIRERTTDLPLMIGYTKDEGTPFATFNERVSPYFSVPILGHYIRWFTSWLISKKGFQKPSEQFRQQVLSYGGRCSLFYFRWAPPNSPWGATHTIELPFLLGSWSAWKDAPMLAGAQSKNVVEKLGSQVKDLWVIFAHGKDLESKSFILDEDFRVENYFKAERL